MAEKIDLLSVNREEFTLDDVKEAIEQIFVNQVEDFYSLKGEKWYKHLLNAVTFGSDRKKKIINDIRSLSALQALFMKVYCENYKDQDKQLNDLVSSLMKTNNTVKKLYMSCVVGVKPQARLDSLSDVDQNILLQMIAYYKSENGKERDFQQYRASISKNLGIGLPEGSLDPKQLEKVAGTSAKVIFRCLMEMRSIDATDTLPGYIEDAVDDLTISNNSKLSIESEVIREVESFGSDYLLIKYSDDISDNIEDTLKDMDLVDKVADMGVETEVADNCEIEISDEIINTILQIKPDETKIFSNKRIHLNTFINCEGTIIFDRCILYYNENDCLGKIIFGVNGSIVIRNTLVICRGYCDKAFVTSDGNLKILFERSTFENCSNFLHACSASDFVMTKCMLHNCIGGFIDIIYCESNAKIISNHFIEDAIIDFNLQNETYSDSVIRITHCQNDSTVLFEGNTIQETSSFKINFIKNPHSFWLVYFNSPDSIVRECTFNEISFPINATCFVRSKFERCDRGIKISWHRTIDSIIEDCVFINCTNVIEDALKISNCLFDSCRDHLISGGFEGGLGIEYSQFINIQCTHFKEKAYDSACITLYRSAKSNRKNSIRNCIFDGAKLDNRFLIMADGYEKPKGTVGDIQDCIFKNCATNRPSNKIIKEYMSYFNLFKQEKTVLANIISNCSGLDNVNKENDTSSVTDIKKISTGGDPIGSLSTDNSDIGCPASLYNDASSSLF